MISVKGPEEAAPIIFVESADLEGNQHEGHSSTVFCFARGPRDWKLQEVQCSVMEGRIVAFSPIRGRSIVVVSTLLMLLVDHGYRAIPHEREPRSYGIGVKQWLSS